MKSSVNASTNLEQEKQDFINKYGIKVEMPATYTYSALFHRQNENFLFTITNSVFPSNVNFTNYINLSSLDGEGEREPDPFIKDQMMNNRCLLLKVY